MPFLPPVDDLASQSDPEVAQSAAAPHNRAIVQTKLVEAEADCLLEDDGGQYVQEVGLLPQGLVECSVEAGQRVDGRDGVGIARVGIRRPKLGGGRSGRRADQSGHWHFGCGFGGRAGGHEGSPEAAFKAVVQGFDSRGHLGGLSGVQGVFCRGGRRGFRKNVFRTGSRCYLSLAL